jgi:hypothetical protein
MERENFRRELGPDTLLQSTVAVHRRYSTLVAVTSRVPVDFDDLAERGGEVVARGFEMGMDGKRPTEEVGGRAVLAFPETTARMYFPSGMPKRFTVLR